MKCWTAGLLVAMLGAWCSRAEAGNNVKYPPRYRRASMAQTYIYKNRHGQVRTREVYPGYASGFPAPAFLYYGYPHSGDDTGIGLEKTFR